MPNFRKRLRLEGYDYSKPGHYFITILTAQYQWILSTIENDSVRLSPIGHVVEQNIVQLPTHYSQIDILNHVIMPNHVHVLISLTSTENIRQKPIFEVIGGLKASITAQCRKQGLLGSQQLLWANSFHERIVRDEIELANFSAYIDANPGRWREDKELVRKM
jgi:REP element-mobilizing transposase RayT